MKNLRRGLLRLWLLLFVVWSLVAMTLVTPVYQSPKVESCYILLREPFIPGDCHYVFRRLPFPPEETRFYNEIGQSVSEFAVAFPFKHTVYFLGLERSVYLWNAKSIEALSAQLSELRRVAWAEFLVTVLLVAILPPILVGLLFHYAALPIGRWIVRGFRGGVER